MASKMATLSRAEELLEQLRAASYNAAVRDLEDIRAHAAEAGVAEELKQVRRGLSSERGALPEGGPCWLH